MSGRAYCTFNGAFNRELIGGMATELITHFFRSFADSLGATINVQVTGENAHHMIEACFKGLGRCLRQAITKIEVSLPTTKGVLLPPCGDHRLAGRLEHTIAIQLPRVWQFALACDQKIRCR